MGIARFEEVSKDCGKVFVNSYFGQEYFIDVTKPEDAIFRIGGTAVNEVASYEGVILSTLPNNKCRVRAFKNETEYFETEAILSPDNWQDDDLHCWIYEYYELDMEGRTPSWIASKNKLNKVDCIFINLDILNKSDEILKRYRISPFYRAHKVIIFNG
jgi:hypothetical protein